nr:hypothetical protein [Microtetraspora malaysiensis]
MSPAGIIPGSSPSVRIAYGTSTRRSEPIAIWLKTRTGREPVRRAMSSPASGMQTNATNAAYRWISPDIERDIPGRSVGKPATSSMQPAHPPTSSAPRRSSRASRTACSAAPVASSDSETPSSHPCGVNT